MEVAKTKVHLPAGLEPPFEVYVNGVRQREGSDFVHRGDELVFSRPLAHEGRLGFWRWTSLFLGVGAPTAGTTASISSTRSKGRGSSERGYPLCRPSR